MEHKEDYEIYEIPREIDEKLTNVFLACLAGKLASLHGPDIFDESIRGYYDFDSGTGGWCECFYAACKEMHCEEVWKYYNSLDWPDCDTFDGIVEELIIERYINNRENAAEAYYQHLIQEHRNITEKETER